MFSYFPLTTETPVEASFVALDVLCKTKFYQALGFPQVVTGCMDTIALFLLGYPSLLPSSRCFIFLILSISGSFAFPHGGHFYLTEILVAGGSELAALLPVTARFQ